MKKNSNDSVSADPQFIMEAHCKVFIESLDATSPVVLRCKMIKREYVSQELPHGLVLNAPRVADGIHDSFGNIVLTDAVYPYLRESKQHLLMIAYARLLISAPSDQALKLMQEIVPNVSEWEAVLGMRYTVTRGLIPALCQMLGHVWPADRNNIVSPYVDKLLSKIFGSEIIDGIKSKLLAASLIKFVTKDSAAMMREFLVLLIRHEYMSGKKAAKMAKKSALFKDASFLKSADASSEDIYLNQTEAAAYFGVSVQTLIRYRNKGDIGSESFRKQNGEIQYNINRCSGVNGLRGVS